MAAVKDEKSGIVYRKGSPLLGALVALAMVLLVLFGLWYYSRPVPPTILDQKLTLTQKESEIEQFHGLKKGDFAVFHSISGSFSVPYPLGYYAVEGGEAGEPSVSFGAMTDSGGLESIDVYVVPGPVSAALAESFLSRYQSDPAVSESSMGEYSADRRSAFTLTATREADGAKAFLKTILVNCGSRTIRISSSIPSEASDDLFISEYMAHYLEC